MFIGNQFFRSPYWEVGGDPNCFDLDWLHQVAVYIAGLTQKPKRLHKFLDDHPWLMDHVAYVKSVNAKVGPKQLLKKHNMHYIISRWALDGEFQSFRVRVNPLLLSPGPIEDIAVKTQTSVEALRMYCAFYFDVRDADGIAPRGEVMRQIVALGGRTDLPDNPDTASRWLVAAAHPMGYTLVSSQMGLSGGGSAPGENVFAELQKLAQSYLAGRLRNGGIRDEDAIEIISRTQDQQKIDSDIEKNSDDADAWDMIRALMELMRPKLAVPPSTKDTIAAGNKALRARLSAEKSIQSTDVEDGGPGGNFGGLVDKLRGGATQGGNTKTKRRGDKK